MSEPAKAPPHPVIRFAPAILVVALAVAAYSSGLLHHLTLSELAARRAPLEAYVAAHPVLSALAYVGAFAAGVSLSLPVALVLTLTGGFLFGALEGGALAAVASTFGGLGIFLVSRTAAGDVLRRIAGPRIQKMQEGAKRDSLSLIISLRLIPMMPYWLINIGAAVIGMPTRAFFIGSAIGVAPSSFIYATLGSGFGKLFDSGDKPSMAMLREPRVLIPLAALMVLSVAPMVWRRLRARRDVAD